MTPNRKLTKHVLFPLIRFRLNLRYFPKTHPNYTISGLALEKDWIHNEEGKMEIAKEDWNSVESASATGKKDDDEDSSGEEFEEEGMKEGSEYWIDNMVKNLHEEVLMVILTPV